MLLVLAGHSAMAMPTGTVAQASDVVGTRHAASSTQDAMDLAKGIAAIAPDDEATARQLDSLAKADELATQIIDFAGRYVGRPYRRGATGPKSFDCSGFTSFIFKNAGVELNRTSRAQYTQGRSVDRDDIRPGDLLFFAGRRGGRTVGHVGMATDVNPDDGAVTFIHASSSRGIRHDQLSAKYFSSRFLGARRVIHTDT